MNSTPTVYLSSFYPSPARLSLSRRNPLTNASHDTHSFRIWNTGATPGMGSSVPLLSGSLHVPTSQASSLTPISQPLDPKRNPRRAARDKGTVESDERAQSTSTTPLMKRVRNRNTVHIECKPCNFVFTRLCVYKAHVQKSKKHAKNAADWDSQRAAEQSPTTCGQEPQLTSGFSVPTFDWMLFDFDNLDFTLLDADADSSSGGMSDASGSDVGSQSSGSSLEDLWNSPALEAPVQATLSIVDGGALAPVQNMPVMSGFFYPGNSCFIPTSLPMLVY